jgi:hypothetical protein
MRQGECRGHHRGRRAGHEFKRVVWEPFGCAQDRLGRTRCFLVSPPGKGVPGDQAGQALAQEFLSGNELEERTRTEGTNKVSMTERERRASRRTNGSRSRAQCAPLFGYSTSEGGEVKPKRPIRGKARSGIARCWEERREGLRAYKPSQQTASNR